MTTTTNKIRTIVLDEADKVEVHRLWDIVNDYSCHLGENTIGQITTMFTRLVDGKIVEPTVLTQQAKAVLLDIEGMSTNNYIRQILKNIRKQTTASGITEDTGDNYLTEQVILGQGNDAISKLYRINERVDYLKKEMTKSFNSADYEVYFAYKRELENLKPEYSEIKQLIKEANTVRETEKKNMTELFNFFN